MCLLVFAWQKHPIYRLIFAGNRDEYHARPAVPAGWWRDSPDILGGRDQEAGGTWLAMNRQARFAVVTNYHEMAESPPGAPTRGDLVTAALNLQDSAHAALCEIEPGKMAFAGFNLIAIDDTQALYLSNRRQGMQTLESGIYGLGNQQLDADWPKVHRSKDGLAEIITERDIDPERLFDLLGDRRPAEHNTATDADANELTTLLSAPFVLSPEYGTRCTTVVMVTHQGKVDFLERRFNADGDRVGDENYEFAIDEDTA